jgi:hypothetical protein
LCPTPAPTGTEEGNRITSWQTLNDKVEAAKFIAKSMRIRDTQNKIGTQ